MGVAVDSTDTWGRVFVADRSRGHISVIYGRSPDLTMQCQLPVGEGPYSVAVDAETGHALVTLRGEPRLAIVEGRTSQPRVLAWLDLEAAPAWVAIDQETRRAFVSLFEAGQVAVLEPIPEAPYYRQVATLESGPYPHWLAVDQASGRLIVSNDGQPESASGDLGNGSLTIFDARGDPPRQIGEPIPASVPSGIAFDPLSGNAFVLENGTDQLMTLAFPAAGQGPPRVSRIPVDPYVDEGQNVNPVDLVFLPATREIITTQANRSPNAGHLAVLRVDDAGNPRLERTIASATHTTGIALDPSTGRVFVAAFDEGLLTALGLDAPTVEPPPPPPIAESMPSPLQVSLAPQDVARTVGISLLVLLLVGAPTPIFNETLESNLGQIQGGLRRLLPGGRSAGRLQGVGARLERFSGSLGGLLAYLVVAAIIYSFLTPGFPGSDALIVLGVALLGIAVATAADILPGQRYVVNRYHEHGRIRVALWTLGLAAVCVLISRLAGLQPGYMYGIIGAFTFATMLGVADEGRMEARGAAAVLVLALITWFARIPFQPAPGVPATGLSLTINLALVGVFVVAVEALVFGLVPLRFLPGQKIWAWSRWRWLLLWGAGLALFVHVLVYPVTVAQPNPQPSSLTTTLVSVGVYGAVAVGFWLFFRWRARRPSEPAAEVPVHNVTDPAAPDAARLEVDMPQVAEAAFDVPEAAFDGPEAASEQPVATAGVPGEVSDAGEAAPDPPQAEVDADAGPDRVGRRTTRRPKAGSVDASPGG